MTLNPDTDIRYLNEDLTRRALRLVLDKTTDMAADVLRVPLRYYNDPKLAEIEQTQILRQHTVGGAAQRPDRKDQRLRGALGDGHSLLITRDKSGDAHVLLNYCRHRGAMPACGSGAAARFTCPYHAWTYTNTGELSTMPGKSGFRGINPRDYGLVRATQPGTLRLHLGGPHSRRQHRRRCPPRRTRTAAR